MWASLVWLLPAVAWLLTPKSTAAQLKQLRHQILIFLLLPGVCVCVHLAAFRVLESAALLHMPTLGAALLGHLTKT